MADTITGSQAAELLGVADANIARTQLARWGITPLHRAAGRGGQNIYNAAQVRQAIANRPGRGRRTDLKGDHPAMTNTTQTERDRAVARVETVADWIMGAIAACDDSVILSRGNNLGQIEMELPKGRMYLMTVEELDNTDGGQVRDVWESPFGIVAAMCPVCHTVGGHDNDCPQGTGQPGVGDQPK